MAFGCRDSIGYIWSVCNQVGKKAKKKLEFLSNVRQKETRLLISDETFPNVKWRNGRRKASLSLGVAICERGLIRGVKAINNRGKDIVRFMGVALGSTYKPDFISNKERVSGLFREGE